MQQRELHNHGKNQVQVVSHLEAPFKYDQISCNLSPQAFRIEVLFKGC